MSPRRGTTSAIAARRARRCSKIARAPASPRVATMPTSRAPAGIRSATASTMWGTAPRSRDQVVVPVVRGVAGHRQHRRARRAAGDRAPRAVPAAATVRRAGSPPAATELRHRVDQYRNVLVVVLRRRGVDQLAEEVRRRQRPHAADHAQHQARGRGARPSRARNRTGRRRRRCAGTRCSRPCANWPARHQVDQPRHCLARVHRVEHDAFGARDEFERFHHAVVGSP